MSKQNPTIPVCDWCKAAGDAKHERGCDKSTEIAHNFYQHDDCPVEPNVAWEDEWSCEVDDECPACGADISPYESRWRDGETFSTPCGSMTSEEITDHVQECEICAKEHAETPLDL